MTNNEEIEKHFEEIIRLCKISGIIGKNMNVGKYYVNFGFKKINKNIEDEMLKDVEERISLCLKDTNKNKEKSMPPNMDWKAEALGYKTSLECIKRTREKFTNYNKNEVKG